jgi:mono/diheme cytochrome c family protein
MMNKRYSFSLFLLALAVLAITSGCYQGRPSEKPPLHVNPNMDNQEKYKALGENEFYPDGSNMRLPVAGTISRGNLREDVEYYTGKDAAGQFIAKNPVPLTMEIMKRGEDRFNIYCTPCHGRTGDGKGIVVQYGLVPPPSFHQDRLRLERDGYMFDVMTNGIRNMQSYRNQVPVSDRWAIIHYFRALQRSQNASKSDVPSDIVGTVK